MLHEMLPFSMCILYIVCILYAINFFWLNRSMDFILNEISACSKIRVNRQNNKETHDLKAQINRQRINN